MSAADDQGVRRDPGREERAHPARIGRYEIRRERGRGAMGVVYEAHDPTLGRVVALKTIRLPFTATAADLETFEQRFFAEARIAARLSHPGIVVVHDAARDAETGTLYMALEYLQGRTLAEIVSGGVAMSWREALRITARIAAALHHAHSSGVVHRDIKPSNIMLLGDGEPKIMDFGIAKAEAVRINLTLGGQLLGTSLYMSPEQALGHEVDARSDLFSLGAIAYALLTGQHAFGSRDRASILDRVVKDQPLLPSALVPGLPFEVDCVVLRAMAKEPAERYPDGNAMVEDIEDVLAGRPLGQRDLFEDPVGHTSAALDLGNPSDTLFSRRGVPTLPPPAPPPIATKGRARLARFGAPAGGFLVTVTLVAAVLLLGRHPQRPTPVPSPAPSAIPKVQLNPAVDPSPAPERLGPPSSEAPVAGQVAPAPASASDPLTAPAGQRAHLTIDFEHSLKKGTLRVWLGATLILDEKLGKKLIPLLFHTGDFQKPVEVIPGTYAMTVEIKSDDIRRSKRISGNLKAGVARHLKIRLAGAKKDLSVELE
jgi:serine/threonine protein kinase